MRLLEREIRCPEKEKRKKSNRQRVAGEESHILLATVHPDGVKKSFAETWGTPAALGIGRSFEEDCVER